MMKSFVLFQLGNIKKLKAKLNKEPLNLKMLNYLKGAINNGRYKYHYGNLKIWRQNNENDPGHFEIYKAKDINVNMSFLEMLDVVNDTLTISWQRPVAFDHDCREGICGSQVNGVAHGPFLK